MALNKYDYILIGFTCIIQTPALLDVITVTGRIGLN